MGIKMENAFDSTGFEWNADAYLKGKGKEPLKCVHCSTPVTHQSAHTRERDDKSILIPAYFRLLPSGRHAYGCKYAVEEEIKTIVKESDDLFESIRVGQYRLRLVMIKEALTGSSASSTNNETRPNGGTTKVYEHSQGKLPAYINSAKRVLQLRALCDSDEEIANHLELVFEGDAIVPWSQFYFETERHLSAFHTIQSNTVQHPIALHGTVKFKKPVKGKNGPTNVLNLVKPKYLVNTDNANDGVGLEVSVWAKNADWFAGLEEDTEVIILGIWRAISGVPSPAKSAGKFQTFTTHKLSVNPVLMAQIVRVPKR